jgi:hypothetical protein
MVKEVETPSGIRFDDTTSRKSAIGGNKRKAGGFPESQYSWKIKDCRPCEGETPPCTGHEALAAREPLPQSRSSWATMCMVWGSQRQRLHGGERRSQALPLSLVGNQRLLSPATSNTTYRQQHLHHRASAPRHHIARTAPCLKWTLKWTSAAAGARGQALQLWASEDHGHGDTCSWMRPPQHH